MILISKLDIIIRGCSLNIENEIKNLDLNYEELYKAGAKHRDISIEQLKAEMDTAINEAWDNENNCFKQIPKLDAFIDVLVCYALSKEKHG